MKRIFVLSFFLALSVCSFFAETAASSSTRPTQANVFRTVGTMREADFLLNIVADRVMPTYPEAPNALNDALTVAELSVDEKGRLVDLRIIQSPGPAFAQATERALRLWKFRSFPEVAPTIVKSTITLYFVPGKVAKSGTVYFAADAPYVGPQRSSFRSVSPKHTTKEAEP